MLPSNLDLSKLTQQQITDIAIEALRNAPADERERQFRWGRAVLAREKNDAEGFAHFYYAIYGRECPKFAREKWIKPLYEARESGKGLLLEAWRGSTKSTILQAFCWYQLGWKPWGSGMIVSASDGASTLMGKLFASVVENSEYWKIVFPNVVKDDTRGWGAEGYFIKDTGMDYKKFVDMSLSDHMRDPSFVGAGITSSDIVGKHPSVFLFLDDIHDENNTRSKKEREAVIESLKANLLPTMSRPGERPYICVACTPWTNDDAYQYLKSTELLQSVKTPVYEDTDKGRVYNWPEAFGEQEVEKWRKALGSVEFARMHLCDITNIGKDAIRFYTFPAQDVRFDWPMTGGADPINALPGGSVEPTSNFALAYIAKRPGGGAVVVDGVLKKCSALEAETEILRAQSLYPGWRFTATENVGGGSLFIQMMRRNPNIRIIESDLRWVEKQGRIRSKRDRLLLEMFPWFENGTVTVNDADTPFLNALRRLFQQFHMLDPKTSPEFDAGDSVYHGLKAMPDVLNIAAIGEELPQPGLKKKIDANRAFMFGRL